VHVVENQHEAAALRESAEQARDGAVREVAFDRDLGLTRLTQARKDRGELAAMADAHAVQARLVKRREVRVERVHEDRERDLALELGGTAREDEMPAFLGTGDEGPQQRGLADPRLTRDPEQRRALVVEPRECCFDRLELLRPTDEFQRIDRHVLALS
jgi:hypothetical protein